MALYEYKCKECGEEFEEFRKMMEDSKKSTCPKCGKEADKQLSRTSFKLEGSGWAKDGYGK